MAIFSLITTGLGALFGSTLIGNLVGGALAFGAQLGLGKLNKPKKQKFTAVQGEVQLGGDVPVQALFGKGKTRGQRAYYAKWDKGNKLNADVFILANGWCDGLEPYIYMYGQKYNLVPKAVAGGEAARYSVEGFIDGDGNSSIDIRFYDGRPGQVADAQLVAQTAALGNSWKATSRLSGLTYVVVYRYYHLKFFRDAGRGRPDIEWMLRGLREYDPTKDSTVAGGNGPQRLNDRSTWAHTLNPAVHRLNYQLGLRGLLSGRTLIGEGKSLGQLDLSSYFVAINYCRTLRKGKPIYECSLWVSAETDHTEALQAFDDAMAGYGLNRRGLSGVVVGAPQIPVLAITDADIPSDQPKPRQPRKSAFELYNHLSGQFTSPEAMWNPESLKPIVVNADVAADKRARQTSIDFLQVHDADIAQYLLNVRYRQNRKGGTATVPVSRRVGLKVMEGEWVTWLGKTWMISEWRCDADLRFSFVLSEAGPDIYDDGDIAPGPIVIPPAPPINPSMLSVVQGFNVAAGIIAGASGSQMPCLKFTWTPPADPTINSVSITYEVVDGDQRFSDVSTDPESGEKLTTDNVVSGKVYRAKATITTTPDRFRTETPWVTTAIPTGNMNVLDNSITAAKLAEAAVTADKIMIDAVTSLKLANQSVSTAKLQVAAVTADILAASSVLSSKLADAAVTSQKMADGAITATKFASSIKPIEVVSALPATGNVPGRQVFLTTDGKLYRYHNGAWTKEVATADLIGQLVSSQLADNAVTAAKIENDAVTASKVANGAITGTKIADLAVSSGKLADGAVAVAKFAAGLRPVEIASTLPATGNAEGRQVHLTTDGKVYRYTSGAWTKAVDAIDLVGEILATQIANDQISTPKLQANAVTTAKLSALAVTSDKVAANAITAGKIAAAAVSATEVAAGAITASKMSLFDSNNLILDPMFQDAAYWSGKQAEVSFVSDADTDLMSVVAGAKIPAPAPSRWRGTSTNAARGMPIEGGGQYRVRFKVFEKAGFNGMPYIQLFPRRGDGTTTTSNAALGTSRIGAPAPADAAYSVDRIITLAADAAWTPVSATVDWGANFATTAAGYCIISDVRITRASSAELIVDGSILTDKLAANSVSTAKLVANAVTTEKLAVGAVTADTIAASAITAAKIAAGAVNATHVAANSITARNLLLADVENLVPNGNIEDSSAIANYWGTVSSGGTIAYLSKASYPDLVRTGTHSVLVQKPSGNLAASCMVDMQASAMFPVNAGETLYGETSVITNNAPAVGGAYCRVVYYDINKAVIAGGEGIGYADIASNAPLKATWETYSRKFVVPGNAAFGCIRLYNHSTQTTTQNAIFNNVIVRRANAASLIVDGSLTATMIAASAITSDKLAAHSVVAGKIAVGAVSADQIAANAIISSKIAANAITTDKLAVGIGANYIENSDFFAGTSTWGTRWSNAPTSFTMTMRTDNYGAAGGSIQIRHARLNPGDVYDVAPWDNVNNRTMRYPVEAGERYQFSVYTYAHRADRRLFFGWFDAAGTNIAYTSTTAVPPENDNPAGLLSNYLRQTFFATAPANAASCEVFIRHAGTLTGGDSYVWFKNAFLGKASAGQTEPAPWSPAGSTMISGGQIVTGSIVAANIAALAITAGKIAAGAVTATELAAGAVTAIKIAAAAITGDKIAANTIGANNIAANAITAKHLVLADYENLVANGYWSEGNVILPYWAGSGGANLHMTTSYSQTGQFAMVLQKTNVNASVYMELQAAYAIAVTGGEQLYGEISAMTNGQSASAGLYFRILWYDASKTGYIGYTDMVSNAPVGNGFETRSGRATAPANARYATLQVYNHSSNAVTQNFIIDRIVLRRMKAANLIVDGSITADKLNVNNLSAVSANFGDAYFSGIARSINGKLLLDFNNGGIEVNT